MNQGSSALSLQKAPRVFAFIDGQNLNLAIKTDIRNKKSGRLLYKGKVLDYKKFRHYLYQKYNVQKAYIFLGYMKKNQPLYSYFRHCGFDMVFKRINEMHIDGEEKVKGNVDIDIAVWSCGREFANFDQAVFVSGDGDFAELYDFMNECGKLSKIIVPNQWAYSKLLKSFDIEFLNGVRTLFLDKKMTGGSGRNKSLGVSGRGRLNVNTRDDTRSIAKPKHDVKHNFKKVNNKEER